MLIQFHNNRFIFRAAGWIQG